MADPLSVGGLGLGAISLTLQVVDQCVKLYSVFSEAVHMQDSYRSLTVRVQMEQQRFVHFATEAGFLSEEGSLCTELHINHEMLMHTLFEIRALFLGFEEVNQKYTAFLPQIGIEGESGFEERHDLIQTLDLMKRQVVDGDLKLRAKETPAVRRYTLYRFQRKAKETTRNIRTVFSEPQRLLWTFTGEKRLEGLVLKLKDLNTFLIALLDAPHRRKLEDLISKSYGKILQLRDDIDELRSLSKALSSEENGPYNNDASIRTNAPVALAIKAEEERLSNERQLAHLKKMTAIKMKRVNAEVTDTFSHPYWMDTSGLLLDLSALVLPQGSENPRQAYRLVMTFHSDQVWVEWLSSPLRRLRDTVSDLKIENRVVLLARLLHEEKPPEFRAPRCLGYVRKPSSYGRLDFGLVFSPPHRVHTTGVRNLRQLLNSRPKPGLLDRITLCRVLADSIDNFHAVDWVHKGLRSENVLFLYTGDDQKPSLASPYITGFELSRPSDMPELTEKPPLDPEADVYRHPHAQSGDGDMSYRKAFDMYSLGVVLLEIATWRPVEDILGLAPLPEVSTAELQRVKARLLGTCNDSDSGVGSSDFLHQAARKCGDAYAQVIEACLTADAIERPAYINESSAAVSIRLRLMFEERVLRRLRLMEEALSGAT